MYSLKFPKKLSVNEQHSISGVMAATGKKAIVSRIKENPALVREAERARRDQDAQRSLNNLVEQLSLGN